MMPGIKYPNARLDDDDNFKFIGWAILAAFKEMPEGWDHYNRDTEIIFDQTDEVERAAKFLAPVPSSCASRKTIYQKKEQPEQHYWGKSQQLAVLLATIQCYRDVTENIQFDIWCTGEIEFDRKAPKLRKVGIGGFEAKLQAFLSGERYQNDRLFIVPQANMTTRHENSDVEIIRVSEFNDRLNSGKSADDVLEKKTILMVGGDELLYLINTIFPLGRNPYKGLDSFEKEDSRFFFGREEETETLWDAYQKTVISHTPSPQSPRFLAIIGASGSGKSSLARAGFLAKLDLLSEEEKPLVIDFTPGSRSVLEEEVFAENPGEKTLPIKNLAAKLARVAPHDGVKETTADKLVTLLLRRDDGLSHFFKTTLQAPVVIFVDQFEELFSLEVSDEKTQERFITNLLHSASDPETNIFVLITIRPGFYQSKRKRHPCLLHDIIGIGAQAHKLHISLMEGEQLERVITEPARHTGSYQFDQRFVKKLVNEIKGSPGALPLLEVTLTRIWKELKEGKMPDDTYDDIGGVVGALAHEANQVYEGLSSSEKQIARQAFLEMLYFDERYAHYGEAQRTRRRIRIADIATSEEDWKTIYTVLQQFAQPGVRFVTFDGDRYSTFVEVTHETIFENWERLEEWLEGWFDQKENRNDILFRQQLDRQLTRWQPGNKAKFWQISLWGAKSRGLMWEKHDYQTLRSFATRHPEHMTQSRGKFYRASVWKHLTIKWLVILVVSGVVSGLILLTVISVVLRQKTITDRERRGLSPQYTYDIDESVYKFEQSSRIRTIEADLKLVDLYWQSGDLLNAIMYILDIDKNRRLGILGTPGFTNQFRQLSQKKFQKISKELYEQNRFVHTQPVTTIALTPNKNSLAFGDIEGRVYMWNLQEGTFEEISSLSHSGSVLQLCSSGDGRFLASAGSDGMLKVWDVSTDTLWEESHSSAASVDVLGIDFSPNGRFLASAGSDGSLKVWNLSTHKIQWEASHSDYKNVEVFSIDFSPDGGFLAAGGKRLTSDGKEVGSLEVGLLKVWKLSEPQKFVELDGHSQAIYSVKFSPDGTRLVSGGQDSTIILWKIDTGEQIAIFNDSDSNFVQSVVFSPDGRKVLAGSNDKTVKLLSIESGRFELEKTLRGHDAAVYAVQYYSNEIFISGSWDGTIRLWNTEEKKSIEQEFLKDFGCDWLQGYLQTTVKRDSNAQPQPEKDILTWCNQESRTPEEIGKQ